jgi:betaine-homocysteine S-methyltransferase
VNCHFDPFIALETVKKMKEGLAEAGLLDKVYLMCQPLAYHTPGANLKELIYCVTHPSEKIS